MGQFLDGQGRHALTQTWLRDGADSARHRAAIALGDAMVQVDTDAAHARGAVVADQLLALQAPLVDCYSSCGLDAGSARDSMARIIAALGLPDTARSEERRVGTECVRTCRSRWWPDIKKKKNTQPKKNELQI